MTSIMTQGRKENNKNKRNRKEKVMLRGTKISKL
jgi:hypothetical protein